MEVINGDKLEDLGGYGGMKFYLNVSISPLEAWNKNFLF